mgnify:CR=1 FL=1
MSSFVLSNAQVLVGSAELSAFTGEFTVGGEVAIEPAQHMAAGGYAVTLPGIVRASFDVKGNADFASGGVSQTFGYAQLGTQYAASVVPAGTAATYGDAAVLTRGYLSRLKGLLGATGKVAGFELGLTSDTAEVNGFVGAPLASRTTSGLTGTAVALTGPTASQRLWAALHVTAASGTNLAVKVQSDDNGSFTSATDRITFSTVSATGWQFSYVDGSFSSETHHRVTATVATGTFSFVVLMGVM